MNNTGTSLKVNHLNVLPFSESHAMAKLHVTETQNAHTLKTNITYMYYNILSTTVWLTALEWSVKNIFWN